jgi:hypothetical protein
VNIGAIRAFAATGYLSNETLNSTAPHGSFAGSAGTPFAYNAPGI